MLVRNFEKQKQIRALLFKILGHQLINFMTYFFKKSVIILYMIYFIFKNIIVKGYNL